VSTTFVRATVLFLVAASRVPSGVASGQCVAAREDGKLCAINPTV
jgi:hypothetical protein